MVVKDHQIAQTLVETGEKVKTTDSFMILMEPWAKVGCMPPKFVVLQAWEYTSKAKVNSIRLKTWLRQDARLYGQARMAVGLR